MKWLRNFRRSTIFVDVLLVMGAIIAIMGLSMFVHFNGKKAFIAAEVKSPVAKVDQAEAQTVANPSPTENNEEAPDQPAGSTSAAKATTLPSTPSTTSLPAAKACDNIKKALLTSKYNEDVAAENNSFNQSILGLSVLSPLYKSLLSTHQANLDRLLSNLNNSMAAINC